MSNDCFVKRTGRAKHGYNTQKEAFKKSQEIQAKGGGYLRPYKCKCGKYHLSSQKKRG